MIRRAGFICRSCVVTYRQQLRRLVEAPGRDLIRHSSTSQASSAGHTQIAPEKSVDTPSAASSAPEVQDHAHNCRNKNLSRSQPNTRSRRNSRGGGRGSQQLVLPKSSPQRRKKRRGSRVARRFNPNSPPRGPSFEARYKNCVETFRLQERVTSASFKWIDERYKLWDHKFHVAWQCMIRPGSQSDPSRQKTGGAQQLKKLLRAKSTEEMRRIWQANHKRKRLFNWPYVMVACLHGHPDRAAQVLEATVEPSVAPFYAVADVLAFIVRRSVKLPADDRPGQTAVLPGLLLHILRCSPRGTYQFRQWVVYGAIADCTDPEILSELYWKLLQYGHPLHAHTRLQIASRLAKDVRYKSKALQILDEIVKGRWINVNSPVFASVVTSLLTFPRVDENETRTSPLQPQSLVRLQSHIYEGIVQWQAFTPNLITHSVLIRNLCQNNELEAAWKLYDIMRDQGIEPDPTVYSTLLAGSKSAGNIESTRFVLDEAPVEVLRDPLICNDLLHNILITGLREARERFGFKREIKKRSKMPRFAGFPIMLQLYTKYFKSEPLQKLIPSDLSNYVAEDVRRADAERWEPIIDQLPAFEPHELLEPGSDTLYIMVIGYIKSLPDAYSIIAFYSRFRVLLKTGNESAAGLVRLGSRVHDVIIKAVTQWEGMLRAAMGILEEMLKDAAARQAGTVAPRAAPEESGPSMTAYQPQQHQPQIDPTGLPAHPAPSRYTWNIILDACLRQRQANVQAQALRILQMMRQHEIEPCRVTWTTLIAGYARWQQPHLAESTLSVMHEVGYDVSEHVRRALSLLRDPEAAADLLRQAAELEAQRDEEETDGQPDDGTEHSEREGWSEDVSGSQRQTVDDKGEQLAAAVTAVEEAAAAWFETRQWNGERQHMADDRPETDDFLRMWAELDSMDEGQGGGR
ncbi:hypothetical protein MMYC01_203228 [Madurella mycetomatis]|uniref:Pentatricopeptide repeat protein n=1 Tax=Madurella mycetomatis TaxID=100816 RepID=A0A175W8I5_9PEZI|nr:hypothetical protein MMYC01_203228 [Madurella mycetomatis]